MSVRLFVGNLPYDTTEAELRDYLSAIGPLSSVYLPINRDTGRPRGFAFVEFSEDSQAQEAIRRFNNQPFKGRNLSISEARARESRPGDDGRRDMRAPREPRPPMSLPSIGRGPRIERPAPAVDVDQNRTRGSRPPERKRSTGRKQAEASFKSERGPKKPIREKAGGRIYEDFEDDGLEREEDFLEDDFSRRADLEDEEVQE